jgi:LysM repeat protein
VAIGAALYVWGSTGAVLVANAGPRPATTATADKPALPAVAPAQPTLSAGPATPTPQATFDDEILRRRAAAEEPAPIGNWPIVAISTPQETIAPATTPTVVAESDAAYVVRAGDTFVGIAAYLGVDDGQLARLNNVIDRDRLTIGQKLKVPTRFTAQSTTVPARPPADSAAAIRPRFIWPAIGVVTTEFGEVGSVWIGGVHTGLDVAAPPGDPVLASESGKVLDAAWSTSRGYGNYVMIDHGVGYRTLYGHLSVIRVKEGQEVKRGQLIGDIGSTGVSSGPHLHFEIHDMGKPVDPIPFIGQKPPADRLKLPRSITAF